MVSLWPSVCVACDGPWFHDHAHTFPKPSKPCLRFGWRQKTSDDTDIWLEAFREESQCQRVVSSALTWSPLFLGGIHWSWNLLWSCLLFTKWFCSAETQHFAGGCRLAANSLCPCCFLLAQVIIVPSDVAVLKKHALGSIIKHLKWIFRSERCAACIRALEVKLPRHEWRRLDHRYSNTFRQVMKKWVFSLLEDWLVLPKRITVGKKPTHMVL